MFHGNVFELGFIPHDIIILAGNLRNVLPPYAQFENRYINIIVSRCLAIDNIIPLSSGCGCS